MANRNNESHFAQVPHENIHRSMFDRSHSHLTTINEGDLVPIYWDEILPGDTVKINLNALIRMSTPIYPVMDNCYCDFYWFYVPNRLIWEHWEEFMGENKTTYWTQPTEYTVPKIKNPDYTNEFNNLAGYRTVPNTTADYMGVPITKAESTDVGGEIKVNALPFRAYALTWNEWFRDQNTQQPVEISTGDADGLFDAVGYPTIMDSPGRGGPCLKVSRYHDYFSSCLPAPQKGSAAEIPITTTSQKITGQAPLTPNATTEIITYYDGSALHSTNNGYFTLTNDTTIETKGFGVYAIVNADDEKSTLATESAAASNITINELRQAIAVQHLLETFARGGTRYREILKSCFGVTSPDSRMQIPEYLGGFRLPININQVIQTSATDSTSPQGNTAAYSCTSMSRSMFTKSFVEHGILLGLAAIRVDHSYQQGLERKWSRSDKFSYYWPQLANLGEMAVYNKEIYAQGTDKDDEVFGYQEAWADYRYHQNRISAEMRSTYGESLDSWHYADYYKSLPKLSSSWISEGTENIDRTLAVSSSLSHQFICDFYFDEQWTRPMPIYSVPGLQTI